MAVELTIEQVRAVLNKHRERIWRQPNLVHFGAGNLWDEDGNSLDTLGIVIGVTEKVDQNTLPPEDRIPSCIEGVPVQFIEAGEIELLRFAGRGSPHGALETNRRHAR